MATIRDLKKDINFLCSEFVADSYLMLHMQPASHKEVDALADTVIDARYGLITLIHQPENKRKRNISKDRSALKARNKAHRLVIKSEFENFLKLIDESYEKLQKLNS